MAASYQKLITQATGVKDPTKLAKIEDCMRNVIFHSTLDWQTAAQLKRGAKDALEVLTLMEEQS